MPFPLPAPWGLHRSICDEPLPATPAHTPAHTLNGPSAWNPELQGAMLAAGAAEPLLQLLLATFEPAAALPASSFARLAAATATATAAAGAQGTPLVAGDAMEAEGGAAAAEAAADLPAEPPLVRCCCTGVWALGMMVRGRQKEVGAGGVPWGHDYTCGFGFGKNVALTLTLKAGRMKSSATSCGWRVRGHVTRLRCGHCHDTAVHMNAVYCRLSFSASRAPGGLAGVTAGALRRVAAAAAVSLAAPAAAAGGGVAGGVLQCRRRRGSGRGNGGWWRAAAGAAAGHHAMCAPGCECTRGDGECRGGCGASGLAHAILPLLWRRPRSSLQILSAESLRPSV